LLAALSCFDRTQQADQKWPRSSKLIRQLSVLVDALSQVPARDLIAWRVGERLFPRSFGFLKAAIPEVHVGEVVPRLVEMEFVGDWVVRDRLLVGRGRVEGLQSADDPGFIDAELAVLEFYKKRAFLRAAETRLHRGKDDADGHETRPSYRLFDNYVEFAGCRTCWRGKRVFLVDLHGHVLFAQAAPIALGVNPDRHARRSSRIQLAGVEPIGRFWDIEALRSRERDFRVSSVAPPYFERPQRMFDSDPSLAA
jgi:hypothetical protein